MNTQSYAEQFGDYPEELLNFVSKRFGLANDAALSRFLELAPPVISKIRHRNLAVGPAILVRILEATNLHIRQLHLLVTSDPSLKTQNKMSQPIVTISPTTKDYVVTKR